MAAPWNDDDEPAPKKTPTSGTSSSAATGVDLGKFAKVVGGGGANSGIFQLIVPKILESGDFSELFDMPNDELAVAGNGTGEVRAWVAAAGAAQAQGKKAKTLAYEAIYPWINGMGVVIFE